MRHKDTFPARFAIAAALLFASTGFAQEIESVLPECGAPGDPVLICGSGFGADPNVSFGDAKAEVLRSVERKILTRVPDGLDPGEVVLDVDGATATFHVVAEGSPVVVHLSATRATPGMVVYVIGFRLAGSVVRFFDDTNELAGTAELVGKRRIGYFKVPGDLATGSYTLRFVNGDGLDSGPCSPTLEVVEAGPPEIESIRPEAAVPGQTVRCNGTNLGPPGLCLVTWTAGDATPLKTLGLANGFDRAWTWVPAQAKPSTTYDVVIEFSDGSSTEETGAFPYEVGTPPAPVIDELAFDKGPAGSRLGIFGRGFLTVFEMPKVEFTRDGVSTRAIILFAMGGPFGDGRDKLVVLVPRSLEDGEYDVTVTVGDRTSNAVVFTVGSLPLTVTSMKPTSQPASGPNSLVVIEGTGFGVMDHDHDTFKCDPNRVFCIEPDPSLKVTWRKADDAEPRPGLVVVHDDREIIVLPPGGWIDPLPVGEYTVVVTIRADSDDPESVEAGTYTVRE